MAFNWVGLGEKIGGWLSKHPSALKATTAVTGWSMRHPMATTAIVGGAAGFALSGGDPWGLAVGVAGGGLAGRRMFRGEMGKLGLAVPTEITRKANVARRLATKLPKTLTLNKIHSRRVFIEKALEAEQRATFNLGLTKKAIGDSGFKLLQQGVRWKAALKGGLVGGAIGGVGTLAIGSIGRSFGSANRRSPHGATFSGMGNGRGF